MTVQKQIDQLIARRASEWVEALRTGGDREREAFVDWLRESRRHVAEYLTAVALDRELNSMDLHGHFDVRALLQQLPPGVTSLGTSGPPGLSTSDSPTPADRNSQRRRRLAIGLAASAALVGVVAAFFYGNFGGETFTTAVGEQRSITLPDGSLVQLNARSQLRVRVDESSRDLTLLEGEALFTVARDPARPFRVLTRNAVVQALGTQFNVYALPGKTTVSVLEGKVRILPASNEDHEDNDTGTDALAAGEEAAVVRTGTIERSAHPNIAAAVAWRQRRLVFQKTDLADMVREFNRYNTAPLLRLEGIEPGSRHYSATFDANDPESFGEFLGHEQDLLVERRGAEIVVRAR